MDLLLIIGLIAIWILSSAISYNILKHNTGIWTGSRLFKVGVAGGVITLIILTGYGLFMLLDPDTRRRREIVRAKHKQAIASIEKDTDE